MRVEDLNFKEMDLKKKKTATAIFFVFCSVCLIEIIAEILEWRWLILLTKPLLAPLLLVYYFLITPRVNYWLVASFSCVWVANVLFAFGDLYITTGTWFFLGYRLFVLLLVLRVYQIKNWLPVIVGSLPFLFVYLVLISISFEAGRLSYLIFLQGAMIALTGGIALAGYVLRGDLLATVLLISTIMFTGTQFIFVVAQYYTNILVFRPLTMLMYAVGQYALLHFALQSDIINQRIPLVKMVDDYKKTD